MGNMDNMTMGFIWADVPEVAHLHAGQLGSASWAAAAGQRWAWAAGHLGWAARMWGIAHLHLPAERQSWTTSTAWRAGAGIHGWTVIHADSGFPHR